MKPLHSVGLRVVGWWMCQANLEPGGQFLEYLAGELHPIVGVDLQGASERGQVAVQQSLSHREGALVGDGVEADRPAEPILAGEDIAVPSWGLWQWPHQVDK